MPSQPDFQAVLTADRRVAPPRWALLQRFLIEQMNRAAVSFVRRYTRDDGTLVWRDHWPGMDGSDDGYESFASFPIFYALGGGEHLNELARRQWDAVTWQFTQYGQVHNEFDAYYDWMHHGESSIYIYFFGLADPTAHKDRARALRFAGMYMGEDSDAKNWDPKRKMIRSPINGSRGPCFEMTAEDWSTHRPILANYLCPYEDVPGFPKNDPFGVLDWTDDKVFAEILQRMNQRMVPGDVPLNLNATSLITNAYLYTGQDKYRTWVLEYLKAWERHKQNNGGILPDNVGPNGKIGQRMDGKWWGGYYGWRWPHGAKVLLESCAIAGANALLLTGDASHLDLYRSQSDMLWELGREEEGVFKVPNRHGDGGWFDFGPPDRELPVHLYYLTHSDEDAKRLARCGGSDEPAQVQSFGKGAQFSPEAWHAYMQGRNPDYPEHVLEATHEQMCHRLQRMRDDDGDPNEWDVHHWQEINPVQERALLQLTTGTPGGVYHGGLLHTAVRHFDPQARRPGLPEGVAALVDHVSADGAVLHLVNTNPLEPRRVLVQAGAFGEHDFTKVSSLSGPRDEVQVDAKTFEVRLGPAAHAHVQVGLRRYANQPSYAFPWHA